MKRVYFCSLILISALALAACSKDSAGSQMLNANQNRSQPGANATTADRNFPGSENYTEAAFSDLSVDAYVMVFGSTGDDGSLAANRIMIGHSEADFENMKLNTQLKPPPTGTAAPDTAQADINAVPQGDRPTRPDFENMSEAERAQRRERMAANGAGPGQGVPTRTSRPMTRLVGQIININEEEKIITVKITEGGSKFIYLSDLTKIWKPKSN